MGGKKRAFDMTAAPRRSKRLQQKLASTNDTTVQPKPEVINGDPPKSRMQQQDAVADEDLPLQTLHHLMWAHSRYNRSFEWPDTMQYKVPSTTIPGPLGTGLCAWIIEAPLNSVEILEAILKPSHPFEIHTARHVHRGCAQSTPNKTQGGHLPRFQRLYAEYAQLQGRLECGREISFICLPGMAVWTIRNRLFGVFTPVMLHYVSIPWSEFPTLIHPWALVLHDRSHPGSIHTYEGRLERLLTELGLNNCHFRRSLLSHGTTPLPECLWDWFAGRPGVTQALPYVASEEEVEANRKGSDAFKQIQALHNGMLGVVSECCLPTVKRC